VSHDKPEQKPDQRDDGEGVHPRQFRGQERILPSNPARMPCGIEKPDGEFSDKGNEGTKVLPDFGGGSPDLLDKGRRFARSRQGHPGIRPAIQIEKAFKRFLEPMDFQRSASLRLEAPQLQQERGSGSITIGEA
jgi:hypothetical protein